MRPDLDAIRARCEAANPGPWTFDGFQVTTANAQCAVMAYEGPVESDPDAEFCAAARSDVPVLLDYIRELEAALDLAIESLRRVVDRRANGAPATQDSSRLRHHDGLGLCDSGVDTHGEARTDGVGVIGLSLPPKEPRG